jgi:predicted ATPase with chaperone activity
LGPIVVKLERFYLVAAFKWRRIAQGGTTPRPSEVTLASRGVLYLDEIAEFPRATLEVLRQPLEDGTVTIARAAGSCTFPARFSLVGVDEPMSVRPARRSQRRLPL